MTDYSKWKVNDLKAELKRRGIAQTGLRLKQQFIDKLEEAEAGGGEGAEPAGGAEEAEKQVGEETQGQESAGQESQEQPEQPEQPEQQPEQQQPPQPERDDQPTDAPQASKPEEQTIAKEQETGTQNGEAESRDERPTDEAEAPRDEAKAEQPVTEEQPEEKKTEQEQPEKAEPPANEPKVTDETPSAEEAEDQRKRKRRSQSPVLSAEAVANKKAKAQDESPRVLLPEDREGLSTEEQLAVNEAAPSVPQGEGEEARPRKGAPPKQDARFKGLFAGTERELARPVSPPPDTEMKDAEVEPAQHVATAAVYIGGLMRPLQPVALKNHLISLASAPGISPNAEVILDYHLDSIKTHCFARFATVSAASRVRAALHATVWPNERNRKALFVDFIPETKVQPWIDLEEDLRNRSGPAPRWEVRYHRTDDDSVEAILDEIDPRSAAAHSQQQPPPRSRQDSFQQDGFRAPPSGPRADRERRPPPPAPIPAESRPSRPGQGFKPLDELFKSTSAKPKLYYLPVSREMADRRLDRFDDLLQKGSFPRRGGDETRRITFEDGDYFVDNGPEFAGGAGGAARGRRRGRGRGRGGFGGDSWRG